MDPFLYANSSHTIEGWISNPICPDYLKELAKGYLNGLEG